MPGEAASSPSSRGRSTAGETSTSPIIASSISRVMPPGRSMVGLPTRVSTVDSTPTGQGPPSRMTSMRPSISSRTCCAVVGLGRPERLAEGAAMGTPAALMRASAVLCSGIRTATVGRPAATSSGTISLLKNISVRGPGQNASMRRFASSGTWRQSCFTSDFLATCSMSGLSCGRPLASNILSTASPSSPFAPRP